MSPRVAFVAGGGAVKAYAFHVGVLAGLEADGFFFRSGLRFDPRVAPLGQREIDTYVGSSAGGCVVASLASGHPVEVLKAALFGPIRGGVPKFGYRTLFSPVAPNPVGYLKRIAKRYTMGGMGLGHLLEINGLFTTAGVERYFRQHVLPSNRFVDFAPELYLTATQVNGVRKVVFGPRDSLGAQGYDRSCAYFNNVQISHALAAAVAVPPIFAPYSIVNPSSGATIEYYDGEVREALSPHIARDAGADFIIASSIWSPYQYDERIGSLAHFGMAALAEQAVHQSIEQKVDADRRQSELYDKLLALIEERDARRGVPIDERDRFIAEVCELLEYRRARALYVTPDRGDRSFFFSGTFQFGARLVERCADAGLRAYRLAIKRNPAFLPELDAAL